MCIQPKATSIKRSKKSITHNQKKNPSMETDPEMTQLIELASKAIKITTKLVIQF